MSRRLGSILLALALLVPAGAARAAQGHIASLFLSEAFLNELISTRLKSKVLKSLAIELDPRTGDVVARGLIRIPVEELKAVNAEPGLGDYRYQVSIHLKASRKGHLILIFPLEQTFFYPAGTRDLEKERIVVPVQLLSLALASARGYLAALSGDFSGFDRQTAELRAQLSEVERQLAAAKDPAAREAAETERQSLQLKLAAIPIERRQLQFAAKEFESFVRFTGEKEINLNEELAARRNALALKLRLSQLAPYLTGVDLEGVRVPPGAGERYLAVDLDGQLDKVVSSATASTADVHASGEAPPSVAIVLSQALFDSAAVVGEEGRELGGRVRNLSLHFKEDGLHVFGRWKVPLFPDLPFHTVVGFVPVGPNVFDLRVRHVEFAHIDMRALSLLALQVARRRINKAFQGSCSFVPMGLEKVRVNVDMAKLLPAFPDLALVGVGTKDGELILKAGKP